LLDDAQPQPSRHHNRNGLGLQKKNHCVDASQSPLQLSTAHDDDGSPTIVGCKYYPAGATTNSDFGVSDVKNLYPVLKAMQEVGMMLCIHSEVTHAVCFLLFGAATIACIFDCPALHTIPPIFVSFRIFLTGSPSLLKKL
jgi:hypothetical protein